MNPEAIPYRMACLQEAVKLTGAKADEAATLAVADKFYTWLLGEVPKAPTVTNLRPVS